MKDCAPLNQSTSKPKRRAPEDQTAEGVPVAAQKCMQFLKIGDTETGNNSSERFQDQTDEEPPAKLCKIVDKSQALECDCTAEMAFTES